MEKRSLPSEPLSKRNNGRGVRHTQALLLFMCLAAAFALRVNISLAVVAMKTSRTKKVYLDSTAKAMVISSFFWGYGLLQTFLGNLGRKRSSTKVFCWCLLISSSLTLAIPFAALQYGALGIIFIRVLIGLTQGGIYPNLTNLVSMWVIPQEKETVLLLVYNGASFGNFLALVSSGYLAAQFDWPSIFYSTGMVGLAIGGLYLYYGRCSFDEHEGISQEEKEFMRSSFGDKRSEIMKQLTVPWRKILTSGPLIALTLTHWCGSWGSWTITTLTPTYLNGVLGFYVESDGFLSALSSLASILLAIFFTILSICIKKRIATPVTFARFLWNSLGMYGSAFALIALSYVKDTVLAIVLITTANAIMTANNIGYMANHSDLSPNFSGVLFAFTNSVANTASILGPLISTSMITDTSSFSEWKLVFLMSAVMLFLGNTIFLFWGSSRKQNWNDGEVAQQQAE